MSNTIIAGSENIEGNIGSCQVNSQSFEVDSWHTQTIAVDSCTGKIIAQNTYFDWSVVYVPFFIIFILFGILLALGALRALFD